MNEEKREKITDDAEQKLWNYESATRRKRPRKSFFRLRLSIVRCTPLGKLTPQTIAAQKSVENFMVIMLERIFSVFSWASFPVRIKKG